MKATVWGYWLYYIEGALCRHPDLTLAEYVEYVRECNDQLDGLK